MVSYFLNCHVPNTKLPTFFLDATKKIHVKHVIYNKIAMPIVEKTKFCHLSSTHEGKNRKTNISNIARKLRFALYVMAEA